MDLILLEDDQASAFEQDNHRPEALQAKYDAILERFPDGPKSVLDLGGGAGHFADRLLDQFPFSTVTILDSSAHLLSKNNARPRKELILGSVSDMDRILSGRKFDVVTMNFFLHHLVGPTRKACWNNCVQALQSSRNLLSEQGIILVAEHAFDGPLGSNVPSNTIFAITRIQNSTFVKFARRYFNTAGTGVCFRSRRNWEAVFRAAGLSPRSIFYMPWELGSISTKLKFAVLGLTSAAQEHFACYPVQ